MPKTKESIAAYNKEYFARPEVIARAKIRNAQYRKRRAEYKKTRAGIEAERRYTQSELGKRTAENKRLKHLYGITLDQYEELYAKQSGKCAICTKPVDKLHVDHCHESNAVRGLLCGSCNRGLGLFHDDYNRLIIASEYLKNAL